MDSGLVYLRNTTATHHILIPLSANHARRVRSQDTTCLPADTLASNAVIRRLADSGVLVQVDPDTTAKFARGRQFRSAALGETERLQVADQADLQRTAVLAAAELGPTFAIKLLINACKGAGVSAHAMNALTDAGIGWPRDFSLPPEPSLDPGAGDRQVRRRRARVAEGMLAQIRACLRLADLDDAARWLAHHLAEPPQRNPHGGAPALGATQTAPPAAWKRERRARDIGAAIRGARQRAGMTMQALADRLGVSVAAVHKIEAGNWTLNAARIRDVARALRIDADVLLTIAKAVSPSD